MASPTRRAQILSGLALLMSGLVALWTAWMAFQGNFTSTIQVTARVSNVGDSLRPGDDVVYRDIIVGSVTGTDFTDGHATLALRLNADQTGAIPANVTAMAVPADIFGATQVVLVPPTTASGSLAPHAVVQAAEGMSVVGLQSALADAYTLIASVQPAQLGSALRALGTAVDGRGREWNTLLRQADDVLRTIVTQAPDLRTTMVHVAAVSSAMAQATPPALQALNDLLGPMRAVLQQQHALAQLLGASSLAADGVRKILGTNAANIMRVVNTEEPFLGVLASSPNLAGSLVVGLQRIAAQVNAAAPNGRANAILLISGINLAAAVQSMAGRPSEAVINTADPPPYTADQCPRYPGGSASGSCAAGAPLRAAHAALADIPANQTSPGVNILLAPLMTGGR